MPERLLNQTWTIRTISPFSKPWNVEKLRTQELYATGSLRDFVKTRGRVERDGTYVKLEWIQIDGSNEHLHIGIYIADAPTAQVVLCYVTREESDENVHMLESFAFALVYGDRKCYEILLAWVEKEIGCVIGDKSFRPSSAHIARILVATIHSAGPSKSQMELTFGTPRSVTKMSEITIAIPPTSFQRLLLDLETLRPHDRLQLVSIADDTPSMIFKALRLFILEAFRIDLQSFPIIRVANSIIVIGANGRVKLVDKDNLDVLDKIKVMVEEHVDTLSRKRKARASTKRKASANLVEGEEENDDSGDDNWESENEMKEDEDATIMKDSSAVEQLALLPVGPHLDGELEDKEMIAI